MNKRINGAVLCGLLACTSMAIAQSPQGGALSEFSASNITRPTPPNAVEVMLAKKVESIDWVDNTLEEALDWLREQGNRKVNVIPRWNHLSAEGVGLDTPVTLKLYETTVADVLNEMLLQISDTGQLTFHGLGNKLTISTRADFDTKLYTRVYDVTDILLRIPDFGETAPAVNMQNAQQTSGGGGGQSVFQGGSSGQEQTRGGEQAERRLEERLLEFGQQIQQIIEPTSWNLAGTANAGAAIAAGAGGGQGRLRVFGNSLIITNTIEVHEKIAGRFGFKLSG
jgi:hypothetical protein